MASSAPSSNRRSPKNSPTSFNVCCFPMLTLYSLLEKHNIEHQRFITICFLLSVLSPEEVNYMLYTMDPTNRANVGDSKNKAFSDEQSLGSMANSLALHKAQNDKKHDSQDKKGNR